jgi:hypothetical protein
MGSATPETRYYGAVGFRIRRVIVAGGAVLAIALATAVSAQWGQNRVPEGPGVPPRFPPRDFADGTFMICKIMYRSVRSEAQGVGWSTDYPYAGINLETRVSELTKTPISREGEGEATAWVVRLTDDALFRCPFTMASDVGTLEFSNEEVTRLREYLLKGGFLWVDDFWGTPAWEQWSEQIARVLPEFPIVDTTPADPIRQALFTIKDVKQVPSIFTWGGPGSDPRERGTDSPHANFRVIADQHGRVIVAMTHNTDIGDSMEREGDDPQFFAEFSPEGYALATNIVLYALTH